MHKVTVNGKILSAEDGTILSELLMQSDENTEHLCGGNGICRKCLVTVDGEQVLSCRYVIKTDITVTTENHDVTTVKSIHRTQDGKLCFALDIGTTTLALALVDTHSKNIIKIATSTNPQRIFGADIISRTDYCRRHSVEKLRLVLIRKINSMLASFSTSNADTIYVSGNTTMLHIFFGEDCSSMGVAPYTPVFLNGRKEKASDYGINGVKNIESLPCISAFAGADTLAGLICADMPEINSYNMLVDLGTNAEIALFSQDDILCTSAAAGPCFEGACISCGMSATDGAICSVSQDGIKTIGNTAPKGICGTGLIDVIAHLLTTKQLDETGFLSGGTYEIAPDVSLTQEDIRQYQLAKAAIYSAIITLLKAKDLSFDNIEKVYISGGFADKINIENAIKTGILPRQFLNRCIAVSNSCLHGTVKYACENTDLSVYTEKAEYLDLADNETFSDLFISSMMFP